MEYTSVNLTVEKLDGKDIDKGMYLIDVPYGNLTALLNNINMEHENHSGNVAAFAITLSVLSIILNSLLVFVIVTTPNLRRQTCYLCEINICVVNIVLSVFVTPLAVYLELEPKWNLGQTACAVWIIMDVLLPFVTILVLLLMSLDSLTHILNSELFTRTESIKKKVVYVTFPWIAGVCTVLPLWIIGKKSLPNIEGVCIYGLQEDASISSPIVTYFIPSLLIIVIMVVSLVHILHQSDIDDDLTTSTYTYSSRFEARNKPTNTRYQGRFSIGTICLASSLFIVMWFPHQFVCILLTYCDSCFPPYTIIMGFTWLGASSSLLVPLTFLDSKVRDRIRTYYWKILVMTCTQRDAEETETHLMHAQPRTSV